MGAARSAGLGGRCVATDAAGCVLSSAPSSAGGQAAAADARLQSDRFQKLPTRRRRRRHRCRLMERIPAGPELLTRPARRPARPPAYPPAPSMIRGRLYLANDVRC